MKTKEHKPGDIFVSSILGAEIETVEWKITSKKKDNERCLACALYETCKIKEDIEERRKDVGSCSRGSRGEGVVYFKFTEESKNISKEKRVKQRKAGDKFFSKILGGILEVKDDIKGGRCDSCAYHDVCAGLNKLRNLESGNCSRGFRGDDKPIYFRKIENKYEVGEEVYELLKEFENDGNLSPEEIKGYQQALLDAVYLEKNGN